MPEKKAWTAAREEGDALVAVNRTMQARDGALVIASIRPEIYQLLQVTNLHRFFAFSDDIQSALESL